MIALICGISQLPCSWSAFCTTATVICQCLPARSHVTYHIKYDLSYGTCANGSDQSISLKFNEPCVVCDKFTVWTELSVREDTVALVPGFATNVEDSGLIINPGSNRTGEVNCERTGAAKMSKVT